MGRGAQDRVRGTGLVHRGAAAVDGQRDQVQPGRPGGGAQAGQAVLLHGEGAAAAGPEHLAEQGEPLGETGAHHDVARAGPHVPGPGQVTGQGLPQLRVAARVAVAERPGRRREQRPAGGGQPGRTGKGGHVRYPRPQVVTQRAAWRGGSRRLGRDGGRPAGHPGARSALGGQPALGHQLAVGLGHRVAGHAQVRGQGPGRRQPGAGPQPPGAHGVAQRGLQAGAYLAAG